MKLLIIRLGAIGDVIMTTPIPKAIKERYPESEITYLVGKWSAGVLRNNPHIDKIIEVDEEWFFKKQINRLKTLIQDLRRERFDVGMALDKSWLFNTFMLFCGIKNRYGFSREHHFINRILIKKPIKFLGEKKEYQYYDNILNASFGLKYNYSDMSLYPTKKEESAIDRYMEDERHKPKFIGIAPGGATNPGQKAVQKRWPKNYYKQLIDYLLNDKKRQVILIGGEDDRYHNKFPEFLGNKNFYDLTGVFNIRQVYYLLKKYCDTFVCNDSGPMHVAAAAKVRKLITIFGPTPSKRFAPKNSIVITSPKCPASYNLDGTFQNQDYCMNHIKVEQLLEVLK